MQYILHHHPQNGSKGFTLAELLISLLILGLIATFTIPKIVTSSQNQQYSSEAREVMAMIAGAYHQVYAQGNLTVNTSPSTLGQYMNYVKIDSSAIVDQEYSSPYGPSQNCSSTDKCIFLHNGGTLILLDSFGGFGGTASTNAIFFDFDPDGRVTDGTTDGPGKAVNSFSITMAESQPITQWIRTLETQQSGQEAPTTSAAIRPG